MSRCDLEIVLDQPNAVYRGGERITGRVLVRARRTCRCEALSVEQFWQTRGAGSSDAGDRQTTRLFRGQWHGGRKYEYAFAFEAPAAPLTYRGHRLAIEHFIDARADLDGEIGTPVRRMIVIEGGGEGGSVLASILDSRMDRFEAKSKSLGCGAAVGGAIGVILFLAMLPASLIAVPFVAGAIAWRKRTAMAKWLFKRADLYQQRAVLAPGETLSAAMVVQAAAPMTVQSITLKLTGREIGIERRGDLTTRSDHAFFDRDVRLCGRTSLSSLQPRRFDGTITLPETAALSFVSPNNAIVWELEGTIHVTAWLAWTEKRTIAVVPKAIASEQSDRGRGVAPARQERTAEALARMDHAPPTPPPPGSRYASASPPPPPPHLRKAAEERRRMMAAPAEPTEADDDLRFDIDEAARAMDVLHSDDDVDLVEVIEEDDEAPIAPVSSPLPPSPLPPLTAPVTPPLPDAAPAVPTPPTPVAAPAPPPAPQASASIGDADELAAWIGRMNAAKRFGGERERLAEAVIGRTYEFDLAVERVEWTLGLGVAPAMQGGRTLVGRVAHDGASVAVRLPKSQCDGASLSPGETFAISGVLTGWNNFYDRAEIDATEAAALA